MGALHYFFPGENAAPVEVFRAAGLGHLFDGRTSSSWAGMSPGPGPGGAPGAVATVGTPPHPVCVEGIEWQDCGRYWLGHNPASPPTPAELERDDAVDGHFVRLADGNDWLVPVARHYDGSTPLPRPIRWHHERGFEPGEVVKRHRDLFAGAQLVWDALMGADESGAYTVNTEYDLLAVALGTNYRIGPAEIGALGLLETTNRIDVLRALCDWPAIEELVKKKEGAAGQPSTHGAEE